MSIALSHFIQRHKPATNLVKPSAELITNYQEHLPESLLELWSTHGFGFYGDGLIQLINPDLYRENFWQWLLLEDEDMTRLPIALTAFGEIFYYRSLSDDGDEDVSFLDPHVSESGDLAWSLEDFFNDWCCDEEQYSDFLDSKMLQQAISMKGPLEKNQIYYYVPALRLGGKRDIENIDKGDAPTHLELLLQLALE
jgi:hypothetical protein